MGRLLQLGTILLALVSLVVPVSEYFDRWDAPGLSHDTEFALFCVVLCLCLVLLVSRLVASLAARVWLTCLGVAPGLGAVCMVASVPVEPACVPPMLSPPLRI